MTHQIDRGGLASAVPGWELEPAPPHVIGVIAGEGIGPEVMDAAVSVLDAVSAKFDLDLDLRHGGDIGLDAQAASGRALPEEVVSFCRSVFDASGAVLCGPGGGRFVYDIRARFDLYCKLTPLRPSPALVDVGVLKPAAVRDVDILMVRDNVGGLYFGDETEERGEDGIESVTHRYGYRRAEVERLLRVAVDVARSRRCRLDLVVKPGGVHAVSRLWETTFERVTAGTELATSVLGVDHAAYRLLHAAPELDVLVSPNMLGDVLADCGGVLLGSRAMTYSGNFGPGRAAVYQTGHGAAYDLAGAGRANPMGQILSVAMLLRESFELTTAATAVEKAVEDTLAGGWRTADVAEAGCRVVGTREITQQVLRALGDQPGATAAA